MRNAARTLSLLLCLAAAARLEAQKTLTDGVKDLAVQISSSTTKEQKKRVAVVAFKELDGQTTVLGTYLAEELVTHLVNSGLSVVERAMLDKLLGEQKLQQTGAIDPDTAKQVGRIAGVDAIVTGSVTDLASMVGINCRIIDTQTGNIFAAASTKITKDDDVKKIMGVVLKPAPGGTASPAPAKAKPNAPAKYFQVGDLRVSVDAIRQVGSQVTMAVIVENTASESRGTALEFLTLIDENGDAWRGRTEQGDYLTQTIAAGTKWRTRWTFTAPAGATGTTFSLTEQGRLLLRDLTAQ